VQPALAVLLGLLALPEQLVVKVVPEFEHLVRVSLEPPVSEPVAASPPVEPPEERLVVELLPFEVPVERALVEALLEQLAPLEVQSGH